MRVIIAAGANVYSEIHWSFFRKGFAAGSKSALGNVVGNTSCGISPIIHLTEHQIETALPKLAKALETYQWIQGNLHASDVSLDPNFQKRFNGFYRVRRNREWQAKYFGLLERHKNAGTTFGDMLDCVHKATRRVEPSFVSKLVGTIDPGLPIIDSVVRKHVGLHWPRRGTEEKLAVAKEIHQTLIREFAAFLNTDAGRYLVRRFRDTYPTAEITDVKMLDFVLWVTRKGVH